MALDMSCIPGNKASIDKEANDMSDAIISTNSVLELFLICILLFSN